MTEGEMQTQWRIELLGRLRAVRSDGVVAQFPTRNAGLLLAYLASHPQHPHPRATLVELLWPEIPPEAGRTSLRVVLHTLRRQLEPPAPTDRGHSPEPPSVLLADRSTVSLNPLAVRTDVGEFEAALQSAYHSSNHSERLRSLGQAVERYSGELLPGYTETWIVSARQHLAGLYLTALHHLGRALEQAGDLERALKTARRAVTADPLREEAHYELMRLYAAAGQPSATLRQYQELERLLREELGETPSAAARALAEELRQSARSAIVVQAAPGVEVAPRPAAPAPSLIPAPSDAVSTEPSLPLAPSPVLQLPAQFTRFFGREAEIAHVAAALCIPENRLLTLTGPGGSGKTRLAIAVAGRVQDESARGAPPYSGGPWFVPLADVSDARRIPEAVRDAMGLAAAPGGEPTEQIVAALQAAPSLLILDNFEQLVSEGAPMVRHLLERAPSLTCLVTSRQRLELEGEREIPVLPLPVPGVQTFRRSGVQDEPSEDLNARTPERLNALAACPSVQLFVDRAQAAYPGFRLTPANAAAVAAVCHRLEGLPLAIELAAARASVLAPQQMLSRLEKRFELLVSSRRDVSTRHRTLRAAIEWSYQPLSPELRRFFARLSVFRGGWTLAAAEAVCSEVEMSPPAFRWGGDLLPNPDREIQSPDVLEYLEQLRQSSLVLAEDVGEVMRYRLLETLREFAAEQLTSDEQTAVARRHFLYFLPLADVKRFYPEGAWMTEDQQKEWLRDLDTEYDNLRAALEWGLQNEPGPALWLAAALAPYWSIRGSWGEAMGFLPRAAEYALGGRADERLEMAAKALLYAGDLAHEVGENQRAAAWLEEATALGRKMGTPEILAAARRYEGRDPDLETADDQNRKMGAAEYEAAALHNLGLLALDQGDYDRARSLFQESFDIRRRLWSGAGRSVPLAGLGWVAQARGDYETAHACYEESLALFRQSDNGRHVAQRLLDLGFLACCRRDYPAARRVFDESVGILRGFGDRVKIGLALKGLGDVALGCQQTAAAADHYRASLLLFRELGHRKSVAFVLEGFARLAHAEGQWSRAVSLLGSAQSLREAIAFPLPRNEQPDQHTLLNTVRVELGDMLFTAAWEEGRSLPWQQAAALALAE